MSFKHSLAAAALSLSLALGGLTPSALAAEHSHHHHGGLEQLQLNQGQKWQSDAPLRRGMDNIRADLAAKLDQIHHDRLPAAEYQALSESLTRHVEYMVVNCQLPRAADDQLHLVLAEILGGIEQMKAGADAQAGAVKVIGALDVYGDYFEHPGWQPLAH